jgi:hypothetical protein
LVILRYKQTSKNSLCNKLILLYINAKNCAIIAFYDCTVLILIRHINTKSAPKKHNIPTWRHAQKTNDDRGMMDRNALKIWLEENILMATREYDVFLSNE